MQTSNGVIKRDIACCIQNSFSAVARVACSQDVSLGNQSSKRKQPITDYYNRCSQRRQKCDRKSPCMRAMYENACESYTNLFQVPDVF